MTENVCQTSLRPSIIFLQFFFVVVAHIAINILGYSVFFFIFMYNVFALGCDSDE